MTTLLAHNARQILQAAAQSTVGIIVDIEPAPDMVAPAGRAKQVLYRFKQEDSDYHNIQIEYDPDTPDTALWLIKREREREQEQEQESPNG